jgi:hypothetical protein
METVAQWVEHMENVCSLPFNSSSLLWNGTRVNSNILHIIGIIGRGFESCLSPKQNKGSTLFYFKGSNPYSRKRELGKTNDELPFEIKVNCFLLLGLRPPNYHFDLEATLPGFFRKFQF